MNTLSNQIKKLSKAFGKVDCRVKTYGKTCTVTFLSRPSSELLEEIKKLDTCEAHGDIMDDTRWYSGTRIQFKYDFPVSETDQEKFEAFKKQVNVRDFKDVYHFKKNVLEHFGAILGQRFLDHNNF